MPFCHIVTTAAVPSATTVTHIRSRTRGSRESASMSKLFAFLGSTIGGAIGWWLGSPVGFMTSFILGIVGTGVGLYLGRRAAIRFLE